MRGSGRRTRYLVKWAGYPLWEATWEPIGNMAGAEEAMEEFRRLGDVSVDRD